MMIKIRKRLQSGTLS